MRKKAQLKKLISMSEESEYFTSKVRETSMNTGLSESRIIEDCMCLGFVCLYSPEDLDKLKDMFRKKHGEIADFTYIDNLISVFNTNNKGKEVLHEPLQTKQPDL